MSFMIALIAALLWCMVSSCRHHAAAVRPHHRANINYSQLFSTLQGTWMSYEYILNLNKTRSPYRSAAFMEGIFSFTIDSLRLRNDTLHCKALMNGHEERDFWIAFDSPDSTGRYNVGINKAREYDNYQSTQPNDNITRIKIDSPFLTIYTNTFDSVRYMRYGIVAKNAPPDYALKQYTTAALFRGAYGTPDSGVIFNSSKVYFDPKQIGRIYGSPAYDSFDINTDVLTQSDSGDYMELFDSRKQTESRSFTYKIGKNVLKIFGTQDTTPCVLRKSDPDDTLPRP